MDRKPVRTPKNEQQQVTLQDYIRVFYRGRWIISISFVVILLSTAFYTFTAPKVYRASGKIIVESKGTMERAIFNLNYLGNQSTLITNQVEILRSRFLAQRLVQKLEASAFRDSLKIFQPADDGTFMDYQDQIEWISKHLEVSPKKDTDVIEISFDAGSPYEAAKICNLLMETYREIVREFNQSDYRQLRQFLEKQLQRKSEELKESEEVLKEYQEREKLVSLDESTSELITRLAESQAQLEQALVEMDAYQEQKKSLERQLEERKRNLAANLTVAATPLLEELQKEYARLAAEKVTYETLLSQDRIDPGEYRLQLESLTNRMEALRKRLQEEAQNIASSDMVQDPLLVAQNLTIKILELETNIKGLQAKIAALQDVVNSYERQLAYLPKQALELARLKRQVEVDQRTYMLMTEKLEETKITEAGQNENIRILDRPEMPELPIKPKKKLNLLLGAILGLGLGIGLTFLREYFDDSIKHPDELERMGFSILATIPEISPKEVVEKARRKTEELDETFEAAQIIPRLITHFDPKSPISEAYRTFRTNLYFKNHRKEKHVILVTSSAPKEGKSTTVVNLAITLAQLGSKTVIVDTDLRRPVIHSIFNLKKEVGVTNYLVAKAGLDDIIKPSFIDNLFIITSGPLPPNPSELLGSDEMKQFIAEVKEQFDVVLFDSPPVIAVTDSALLSTMVDGVVLVIKAHQTHREAVRRAKMLLENVEANIFGCLLNSVKIEKSYGSYFYYYYYHYYQYYGHDLKRRKLFKS